MPRNLHANFVTAMNASSNRPRLFYEGVFASATVRWWTGVGDITMLGNTYVGNGYLHGMSDVEESVELRANGVDVIISGIPAASLSMLLTEARAGKSVKLYLAFLDSAGAIIANTPYCIFQGMMDVPEITETAEGSLITLGSESRMIDIEKSSELRYTHDCLKSFYPADLGAEFIAGLQDWDGFWGTTKTGLKKAKKQKRTNQ